MPKESWIDSVFSKEEKIEQVWKKWAEAQFRSGQELMEIVYDGQFEEEYQKRALFLLLAPETQMAPFFWKHYSPNHYLCNEVDFKKINEGLRARAIYWLTKFIDLVKFNSKDNHKADILHAYNQYILQFLSVLPLEDNNAEDLFPCFSINDLAPWESDEESSGYNPLLSLWQNPSIPEKWKKIADTEIRQVIKSELQGNSKPRIKHENALKCYAKHLQSVLANDSLPFPYSRHFFADQMNFLTSLEISDQKLIKPWLLGRILDNFENAGLKWQFCRFAVLRDGNFTIFSESTEEVAKKILEACGTDSQVSTIIRNQLSAYQESQRTQKEKIDEQKKNREAFLSPMRKLAPVFPAEYDGQ